MIRKLPPGRLYEYKTEYDDMIIEFAQSACPETNCVTNDHYCDLFDCCEDTLYSWSRQFPSFSRAFKRAQAISKRRMIDHGMNHFYTDKKMNVSEKTYALILRHKFGYDDKTYIKAPEIAREKNIVKKAELTIDYMLEGLISLEEGERLLNSFKVSITVENEAELRPLVEQLQELVKERELS